MRGSTVTIRATLVLAAFLIGSTRSASAAAAHEDATLEGPEGPWVAGETVEVEGAGFAPGEAHRLVLRGTLDDFGLGTVEADPDSAFTAEVALPREARPGRYRLVAMAADGDEVAGLEVTLRETAPSSAGEAGSGGPVRSGERAPAERGARADEIRIERSRSGIEWAIIGLLIGLGGGAGLALVVRR